MGDIGKITAMLRDAAVEKRMAATIVLGELRARGGDVVDALTHVALHDVPTLQTHALEALSRIGAKRSAEKLFALLSHRELTVRSAAAHTIASVGPEIVASIKARLSSAPPDERRGLDAILAELGGKDAFGTLLSGLANADVEAANAAALGVRAHLRDASRAEKRSALAQTEKFLTRLAKSGAPPTAISACVKILGLIGETSALPIVLAYAANEKADPTIRRESLIALRFVMPDAGSARDKAVAALIDCAAGGDRALAEVAMLTLGPIAIDEAHEKRLRKLIDHPEFERARLVIEKLGQQRDAAAARLLAVVVARAEKRRAERAAAILSGRAEAAVPLAKLLLDTNDSDRRWLIRTVLGPMAAKLPPALRTEVRDAGIERMERGERGWEAFIDIAYSADEKSTVDGLRELAAKLRKKSADRALAAIALVTRSDLATDEDRWLHALLELGRSSRDLRPAARAGDAALSILTKLNDAGFDVVARVRKDRTLELDDVYYLGFHFAEAHESIGKELLAIVAEKGGRTKIGKMAKSKLALA